MPATRLARGTRLQSSTTASSLPMKFRIFQTTNISVLLLAMAVFTSTWGADVVVFSGFSIFRLLAFAALLALVSNALLKGAIRKHTVAEISLLLLWLWSMMTIFWSLDPTQSSLQVFYTALTAYLLFFATYRACLSSGSWEIVGFGYIVGTLVTCFIVFDNATAFAAGLVATDPVDGRSTVGELNANFIAYSVATSIPMALTLLRYKSRPFYVRLILVGYVVIALGAVLLTGSRGSVLAAGATLFVFFATYGRRNLIISVVGLVLSVVAVVTLYDYLPDQVRDRFETFSSLLSGDGSVDLTGREHVWPLAAKLFFDHPLTGIGAGAFKSINPDGIGTHNVALAMAAETGLPGLLLFFFTVALIVWGTIRNSQNPAVRQGGLLLLITWLPIAMTGVWEASAVGWMAFGWFYAASKHPWIFEEKGKKKQRVLLFSKR